MIRLPSQGENGLLDIVLTGMGEENRERGLAIAEGYWRHVTRGAQNLPTTEEFVDFLYWSHKNGVDPLLDECYFYVSLNQKGKRTVFRIVGYTGWLKKVAKVPGYRGVDGEAVCEKDDFEWDAVNQVPLRHVFGKGERGPVRGAWARIKFEGKDTQGIFVDRDEFMSMIPEHRRSLFHEKLSKHMTRIIAIRHIIRQAAPDVLVGAVTPEELGGTIGKHGFIAPLLDGDAPTGRGPMSKEERRLLIEEIGELFGGLGISDPDEKVRNQARRKKAELVLERKLGHAGLADLYDGALIKLATALREELVSRGTGELASPKIVSVEGEIITDKEEPVSLQKFFREAPALSADEVKAGGLAILDGEGKAITWKRCRCGVSVRLEPCEDGTSDMMPLGKDRSIHDCQTGRLF